MQIHVAEQLKDQPALAIGLKETMKLLQEEIAVTRFGPEVTAEVVAPNGSAANGAAVEVKLSDSYGSFSRSFTQKDFNDYHELVGGCAAFGGSSFTFVRKHICTNQNGCLPS